MDTLDQIAQIYRRVKDSKPSRKRKSKSDFLTEFKARVTHYIMQHKHGRPLDHEKLDQRLNAIAMYCKKHGKKPKDFIQYVADLAEDVIVNKNSMMYKDLDQHDLF